MRGRDRPPRGSHGGKYHLYGGFRASGGFSPRPALPLAPRTKLRRLPKRGAHDRARIVTEPDEKEAALEAFTERLLPGRWAEVRWPTPKELKATSVLTLPIEEGSAKVRSGPPIDDETDYALDVWAGVVPLSLTRGEPVPDLA